MYVYNLYKNSTWHIGPYGKFSFYVLVGCKLSPDLTADCCCLCSSWVVCHLVWMWNTARCSHPLCSSIINLDQSDLSTLCQQASMTRPQPFKFFFHCPLLVSSIFIFFSFIFSVGHRDTHSFEKWMNANCSTCWNRSLVIINPQNLQNNLWLQKLISTHNTI